MSGNGMAKRDFLHVNDMANASIHVMELDSHLYKQATSAMLSHINVGTGLDISISEMAKTMKSVIGFEGEVVFDKNKPDGAFRKLTDVSCLSSLGWKYTIAFEDGLRATYDWYLKEFGK